MLHYLCVFVALSAVPQVVLGQTCIDFNSSCQQDNQCAFVFTKPRQEGESCPQNVDLVDVDQMMQTIRVLDSAVETVASTISILNHTVSFQIEQWRQELLNSGDPCHPNPCSNGGTCSVSSDPPGFTCGCPPCHHGNTCQLLPLDPCSGQPCQNGGSCVEENVCDYTCNCMPDWTGPDCEHRRDPCNPNPCSNVGTCTLSNDTSSTTGYECQCPQCYSGNNCEISHTNPCGCNMCFYEGICLATQDCTDYFCLCNSCHTGKDCQTTLPDPCSSNPCQHGGTCQTGQLCDDYTCLCYPCYFGTHCEMSLPQNPCESTPCLNGGSCLAVTCEDYQCSCAEGWTGPHCETTA